jgi:hypothetical protein
MMARLSRVNAFFLPRVAAAGIAVRPSERIALQPGLGDTDAMDMTDPEQPLPRRKTGLALFSLALAFVLFSGGNTLKHATSTDDLLAVFGLTMAEGASIRSARSSGATPSPNGDPDDNDLIPQQIAPAQYAVGDSISLLGGVFVMVSVGLMRRRTVPAPA